MRVQERRTLTFALPAVRASRRATEAERQPLPRASWSSCTCRWSSTSPAGSCNRGEPFDDLLQVGTIGLIKAIDRFDTERGVEFSTYATPTIVGEIKRHFRDRGWAIRVPRRLQELRLSITTATADLAQQLGRSPTVSELAARIGVTDEEILEGLESANAYSTLSLDAPDPSDDGALSMIDAARRRRRGARARREPRDRSSRCSSALDPREKRILMLRFFRDMTQSQIAEEIGISQMHVSRLLGPHAGRAARVARGRAVAARA